MILKMTLVFGILAILAAVILVLLFRFFFFLLNKKQPIPYLKEEAVSFGRNLRSAITGEMRRVYDIGADTDIQALLDSIAPANKNVLLNFTGHLNDTSFVRDLGTYNYEKIHNRRWTIELNDATVNVTGEGFIPRMDGVWKVSPKNAEKQQGVKDILQHMDRWTVQNGIIKSGTLITTVGTKFNNYDNLEGRNNGTPMIYHAFGLFATFNRIENINMDEGIFITYGHGYIQNATVNNSGSNQTTITQLRMACMTGTKYGLKIVGSNGVVINSPTLEGGSPITGISINGIGANTMKSIVINDIHVECNTTDKLIFISGYGQCILNRPFIQTPSLIKLGCKKNIIIDEAWINNPIECTGEFYGVRPTNIDKFKFVEIPKQCYFDTGSGFVSLGKNGLKSSHGAMDIITSNFKNASYGFYIQTTDDTKIEFGNDFNREIKKGLIKYHPEVGDYFSEPVIMLDDDGNKAFYSIKYKREK